MFIEKIKHQVRKIPAEVYVFFVAFIYRLPGLGYSFINDDAFEWKRRGYMFGTAVFNLDPAGTAVTYHPGVPLLWSQTVAIKIFTLLDMFKFKGTLSERDLFFVNHHIQKLFVVGITSALIAVIFYLIKRYLGNRLAILTILVLLLEPFFLAMARVIHNDLLLSSFMFVAVVLFYRAIFDEGSKNVSYRSKPLIYSGLFAALAMLTKSAGIFVLPFWGLTVLYAAYLERDKGRFIENVKRGFLAAGYSFGFFVLIWPAMWVAPISTLQLYLGKGVQATALEKGHGHMWFGKETFDPGWPFYPVIIFARYSPLLVLGFLYGLGVYLKRIKESYKEKPFITVMLLYVLTYFLMVTLVSKKLDRYSLPLVYPMAVVAIYHIGRTFEKKWLAVIAIIFIIYRAVLLAGLHPNYLAYFSPLVGGVDEGRYIVEPKWDAGYDKVAEYFNEMDNPEKIRVAIADYSIMKFFAKFQVLNIQHSTEAKRADYFVLPVHSKDRNDYYKSIYRLGPNDEDEEGPETTIKITGVEYYEIYKFYGRK